MTIHHRTEMTELLRTIASVKDHLRQLVIAHEHQSIRSLAIRHRHLWSKLASEVEHRIEVASRDDRELRTSLYNRRMRQLQMNPVEAQNATARECQELSEKEQAALAFIREKGPIKGLAVARYIDVDASTFRRHYVKKLRSHGVRNDGNGYYVER